MESIIENSSAAADKTLSDLGFYWREKNGVFVLVSKALEKAGFVNGFSTRLGGVSPYPENSLNLAGFGDDSEENIFENRKRFLSVIGENFSIATAWQVHGDGIKVVVNKEDIEDSDDKRDALISDISNVLLGVKTADCVPVLIGDAKMNAFAAVHAGWRGTLKSIVKKTIGKLKEAYSSNPEDLVCAIGPAAGGKNYEVGREVIDAFKEKFSTSGKLFQNTRKGHALIDLHMANKDQLIETGVKEENIFTAPFCTMERSDLFFSYRIDNKTNGKTGRSLSVIGRKD